MNLSSQRTTLLLSKYDKILTGEREAAVFTQKEKAANTWAKHISHNLRSESEKDKVGDSGKRD